MPAGGGGVIARTLREITTSDVHFFTSFGQAFLSWYLRKVPGISQVINGTEAKRDPKFSGAPQEKIASDSIKSAAGHLFACAARERKRKKRQIG